MFSLFLEEHCLKKQQTLEGMGRKQALMHYSDLRDCLQSELVYVSWFLGPLYDIRKTHGFRMIRCALKSQDA